MTNEQILEKQVEALEKLNQLKQAVIDELEAKVARLEGQSINIGSGTTFVPYISSPVNLTWQCPDGNPHQYPQFWGGTSPPCCQKCGQQAGWGTTVTVGGGMLGVAPNTAQGVLNQQDNITYTAHNSVNLPVHTTGYVQPVDLRSATASKK